MANFFDELAESFGFKAARGGGSREAFENFQKYAGEISPLIDRARALIASQRNPFIGSLTRPFGAANQAVTSALRQVHSMRGDADSLGALLGRSTLTSTSAARSAAANAARIAGGGRGGLAFGGGAGAIASRAAQDAATQQSIALTQAQVGAEQFRLGFEQQLTQQQASIAGLLSQLAGATSNAMAQQASLFERRNDRELQVALAGIQSHTQLANTSLGGGIQGDQARAERGQGLTGFLHSILG